MTIAITGASGKLGSATIAALLKKKVPAKDIVAVVRDPAKVAELAKQGVTVRQGDYTQVASLEQAFAGVDRLVFISTSALGEERMLHHRNVVQAAKQAGVKHIIYTSVVKPTADAKFAASPGHFHTETLLRESGIPYTLFRNNLYLDILPMFMGNAVESGKLVHSTGGGRIGFIARNDIAEALANVAAGSGHEGKIYPITTTGQSYSFAQIAEAVAKATGKKIDSIEVDEDAFRKGLEAAGLPPPIIGMSTALHAAIRAGEFDMANGEFEKLLGRKPTSLQDFATQTFGAKA